PRSITPSIAAAPNTLSTSGALPRTRAVTPAGTKNVEKRRSDRTSVSMTTSEVGSNGPAAPAPPGGSPGRNAPGPSQIAVAAAGSARDSSENGSSSAPSRSGESPVVNRPTKGSTSLPPRSESGDSTRTSITAFSGSAGYAANEIRADVASCTSASRPETG